MTFKPSARSGPRVLPTPDLLSGDPEVEDPSARALLGLTARRPRWTQRLLGRLSPADRGARVLTDHRRALALERAGSWGGADFLWERIQLDLAALSAGQEWGALSPSLADVDARRLLALEVVAETHAALYNGRAQSGPVPLRDRAFAHLAYLRRALHHAQATPEDSGGLLEGPTLALIEASLEAKQPEAGREACEGLLELLPARHDFQGTLSQLHIASALANAEHGLAREIDRLDQARRRYPGQVGFFPALGLLHQVHAVKQANAGRMATALESIAKSLAYDPGNADALRTREELEGMLAKLQVEMRGVSMGYGRSLTPQGMTLFSELNRGREAAELYEHRNAPGVRRSWEQALALTAWRTMNLPVPAAGEGDQRHRERALLLLPALGDLMGGEAQDAEGLRSGWLERAPEDLQDLPVDKVVDWVLNQRRGSDGPAPAEELPTDPAQAPGGFLSLSTPARGGGGEPWDMWLFSRRDPQVKALAVAACLLLAFAISLLTPELQARAERGRALKSLEAAAASGNAAGVIQAADEYLGVRVRGRDSNEDAVHQALAQWLPAHLRSTEGHHDQAAWEQLERYLEQHPSRTLATTEKKQRSALVRGLGVARREPPERAARRLKSIFESPGLGTPDLELEAFSLLERVLSSLHSLGASPLLAEQVRDYLGWCRDRARAANPELLATHEALLIEWCVSQGDEAQPAWESYLAALAEPRDGEALSHLEQSLIESLRHEDPLRREGAAACLNTHMQQHPQRPFVVAERERRDEREAAYHALVGARRGGDAEGALEAAGTFLEVCLLEPDPREDEVRRSYAETLVTWFAALPGALGEAELAHLERYRSLANRGGAQ
jgi:hypothetical protein